MVKTTDPAGKRLRVLHVLRAPLGGLFRHVLDLTREQIRSGHEVGLVTDAATGGATADAALESLRPGLALGLSRVPMRRDPHLSDLTVMAHVVMRIRRNAPDVVHGHGSKGAAFARLSGLVPGASAPVRAYTPHGGSFNFNPGTPLHRLYMGVERVLQIKTDLFLFESAYIADRFNTFVGAPRALARIVPNGISPAEFVPVQPNPDAADFVYVGELRSAKGIDTLIEAVARTGQQTGMRPRTILVGSGPDQEVLKAHARRLGLESDIAFAGLMPAREAFRLGRALVVPSRAESLPYIVLEAAGARVPLIATNVGGIPEIFGPYRDRLIPSNSVACLSDRMIRMLHLEPEQRDREAIALAQYVRARFSITGMTEGVMAAYADAVAAKTARGRPVSSHIAVSS